MILFLAGTSDARELALTIQQEGYKVLATVVTDNAAKELDKVGLTAHVGRLTTADMVELIREGQYKAVVDGSHPYAVEASHNAKAAAVEAGVPYLRYERAGSEIEEHELITVVDDYNEAAELAAQKRGVIMLTTGSKTLHIFAERLLGLSDTTLVARMLPRKDNMTKCEELGVEQKNIVAMQGPFSKELNKALYRHYGVTLMITKESGKVGAVDEKLSAALEMGIEVIMIGRPEMNYETVYSDFTSVIRQLNDWLR
jgi:precorrin-6A/cobalt-precorrin-6A reductase